MNFLTTQSVQQDASWTWPFQVEKYDCTLTLSDIEQVQLEQVFRQQLQIRGKTKRVLQRLYQPIADVCIYLHTPQPVASRVVRTMLFEMLHREKTFWAWSVEEWRESICPNPQAFAKRYGLSLRRHDEARLMLAALAYLLCPHICIEPLLLIAPTLLTNRIFGREAITTAVGRIRTVLQGWGYRQHSEAHLVTCVSYLLLKNRNPLLDHLTVEVLQAAAEECPLTVRRYFFQVSRALKALGIISKTLPGFLSTTFRDKDTSLSQEWFSWCERWRKQTTLQRPENVYYPLLMIGRWLKAQHPDVTNPAQWTYDLATEFIAAVNQVKIGEWANPSLRIRR
ncbi:MAG TPA: hypothetical protein VHZ51_08260, partial [Ktedonobacteraceae bacterium]|nr:hypothetical protein [Ktedonobacteraceae bacterium]